MTVRGRRRVRRSSQAWGSVGLLSARLHPSQSQQGTYLPEEGANVAPATPRAAAAIYRYRHPSPRLPHHPHRGLPASPTAHHSSVVVNEPRATNVADADR